MLAVTLALAATPFPPGYVDDSRCIRCHEDIASSFASHGMANACRPVSTGDSQAEFGTQARHIHQKTGLHYQIRRDAEDRMWVRQYELAWDGKPINDIEIEAHWAIGSANHARTWLHHSPSGELWEIPVTWWTDHGWDMSPGFDRVDHDHFARQIGTDCIFCHTAMPSMPSDRAGHRMTFPDGLPDGIGCQRCHGPGAAHVEAAYSVDATDQEIADSILNPADLDPARAEAVCLQCHMQPTSRLPSVMRTHEGGAFDFRPGDLLGETLMHVDYTVPGESDRFEVNHHAYRLRQSACWTDSGALSCVTCHDPHQKLTGLEAQARTRNTCLTCHESESCKVEEVLHINRMEAQDCAQCHMPTRRPSDAIHTLVTDHRIQSMPDDLNALQAKLDEEPPPSSFTAFPLHEPTTSHSQHAASMAMALSSGPVESSFLQGSLPTTSLKLAAAQRLMDTDPVRARSLLETVAEEDPTNTTAVVNLALLEANAGDKVIATDRLEALLQADPLDADAHASLSALHATDAPAKAIAHARRAAELRDTSPDAAVRLGTLLLENGDLNAAIKELARAEALHPDRGSNAYNLGLAYWKSGNVAQATRTWRHAAMRSSRADDTKLQRAATLSSMHPGTPYKDALFAAKNASQLSSLGNDAPETAVIASVTALQQGDVQSALQWWPLASTCTDKAAVRLLEAMLRCTQGQHQEAQAIIDRVQHNAKMQGILRQVMMATAQSMCHVGPSGR